MAAVSVAVTPVVDDIVFIAATALLALPELMVKLAVEVPFTAMVYVVKEASVEARSRYVSTVAETPVVPDTEFIFSAKVDAASLAVAFIVVVLITMLSEADISLLVAEVAALVADLVVPSTT